MAIQRQNFKTFENYKNENPTNSFNDFVLAFIENDPTARSIITRVLNGEGLGLMTRLLNDIESVDEFNLQTYALNYLSEITESNFESYTIKNVNNMTQCLLDKQGKLLPSVINIFSRVAEKNVTEVENKLYGNPENPEKVKELSNAIVSAAVTAVSLVFGAAIRMVQGVRNHPLKELGEYSYLVTNLTPTMDPVAEGVVTFKTISQTLSYEYLVEQTDPKRGLSNFIAKLNNLIEGSHKHYSRAVIQELIEAKSIATEISINLSQSDKLPYNTIRNCRIELCIRLKEIVYRLENSVKKDQKEEESLLDIASETFSSLYGTLFGNASEIKAANMQKSKLADTEKSKVDREVKQINRLIATISYEHTRESAIIADFKNRLQIYADLAQDVFSPLTLKTEAESLSMVYDYLDDHVTSVQFDKDRFLVACQIMEKMLKKKFESLVVTFNDPAIYMSEYESSCDKFYNEIRNTQNHKKLTKALGENKSNLNGLAENIRKELSSIPNPTK